MSVPILTIRLELIEKTVALRPPLDESSSEESVQETDYIGSDDEVKQLVSHITMMVRQNADECKALCELFLSYDFIWKQDVAQTFAEFLQGKLSPNPLRSVSKMTDPGPGNLRVIASTRSFSRASTKSSIESAGLVGTAERPFLTPKMAPEGTTNVPSLDEFDVEIDIYKTARDQVMNLEDHQDIGWLRVDMRPIKHALSTHASKWIWTFTKYLSDQVTSMLSELDEFLKRTEPEIESITGEEKDTVSFMKMMRLFNEVSAQQHKMEGKFAAMQRTVLLVKKYGQKLPDTTETLFEAAPHRWNSLRTKVSLAKQRLGPRIQSQSDHITKDLSAFADRVLALHEELDSSDVYSRDCAIKDAWHNIDNILRRLEVLETEAHDLKELQELLEANIVNFDLLKQCRSDLTNLKELWETVRLAWDLFFQVYVYICMSLYI
ncbi:hypothetical protein NP493_68g02016 [Ridgeia piscesae]|uniref:Uncharacterized protein n=1 Tax=Ridgeia piscesae TaxID=27915 RepID=A0AAD9PA68_RIDPI|nr:hypothetical protein NP493_68g02016 [Ridgeia piscesae]